MTPALWAACCILAPRPCGSCELCAWQREADRWAFAAAWTKQHPLPRPSGSPRWPSLDAALVALVDWERDDRAGPSALGPMLAHIARGGSGDGGASRPDDPLLRRASDIVHVRQALESAFPQGAALSRYDGAETLLSREQCMSILVARTPGALPELRSYEALSKELGGVTLGDLRALIRRGRRAVLVELAARGLVPPPPPAAGLAEAIERSRERWSRAFG